MPWPTGACPAVRGEPTLTGLPACLSVCPPSGLLSPRHSRRRHPETPAGAQLGAGQRGAGMKTLGETEKNVAKKVSCLRIFCMGFGYFLLLKSIKKTWKLAFHSVLRSLGWSCRGCLMWFFRKNGVFLGMKNQEKACIKCASSSLFLLCILWVFPCWISIRLPARWQGRTEVAENPVLISTQALLLQAQPL